MRYSSQNDIVTGSPVAGRNHYEMENQIGYFVNIIALNDSLNPQDDFQISIKKTNTTISEALIHQQYPFDSLVESLNLKRDMSRSPLFDVMVVVDTFESFELNLHGLEIKKFTEENNWNFSRYDLVFHFQTEAGQIILDINYNNDLFDCDRINKLLNHFENLTESALLSPNIAIGKLNLLSKSELKIIESFSVGPSSVKNNFTIPELFKIVCNNNKKNIAVQQGQLTITYKNLQQYSDFLTSKLINDYGVALGDRIIVIAHRNIESVVCMLAIMRAGAIYVPIDPANPKERITGLIKKARSNLILLVSPTDLDLMENCNIQHVLINEKTYTGEYNHHSKFPNITNNDAAYLIFTSGSTGEPKGVIISHGGFINMSLYQIDVFKIDTSDRVLQFASPSFDASLANMFMALFAGASIILPSKISIETKENFLEFLQLSQSTVVTLPPSFLRALNKESLHSVRVLITAGEAAPVEELAHYAESMNVFNAYGPTEYSVCASVYSVKSQDRSLQRIPIGKPISNSKIIILDSTGNFCPLGIPGDIFLAGTGLSLGYFDDIELTHSKFIFIEQLNEYVYKTGDIGCWIEDGSVDIFGRNDDQIKISGHRIEIGEIEHALRDLPGIADAAVTSVQRSDKSLSLAAYYCLVPAVEIWPSVAEFFVYDDVVYSSMANDQRRNKMYRESFERHLKGKVVVDIGTGPFAILSRIAIDAGAERVYAIDLLESTANKARQTVYELGLSDKIIVLQGDARTIQLPELVDFCISEIVGGIGGSEGAADIINQSRKLLKNPHQILPQRSITRIAAVSLESGSWEKGFSNVAAHYVEKIFNEIGSPFDLRLCIKNFPNSALISSQGILEDLDFTNNVSLESEHSECLIINKPSYLTGFLVWLQLHIDSISSVDILENPDSWLPVYIPIDTKNINLMIDDRLHLYIVRKLSKNLINPDFNISGFVDRDGQKIYNINCNSLHFGGGYRQTSFYKNLFANNDIPTIHNLDSQAVRRALAERLPSYAIPAFLINIDAMPLNVNGKIDKKSLPNPLSNNNNIDSLDNSFNPLVKIVLQVWRDVLGRQDIGVHDDFFMLGGDSMRAIQMISKFIALGMRTEIRHIFQNPTVSKLSNVIQNTVHITDQNPVIGEAPLTPIQSWFFEQMKDSLNHFHQAVCLRSKHQIELDPLRKAFTSVWIHHDALRAKFIKNSGTQVFADPGDVPSITVIQSADNHNFKEYENKVYHHTNIEEGHLFSALLISSNDRQELFLIAHHLVVDKVSWGIILEDFASAYESALKGQTPVLPLKSDSYRDHAVRIKSLSNLSDWSDMSNYCRNITAPLSSFFDRTDGSIRRGGDMLIITKLVDVKATSELFDCIKYSNGINLQEVLLLALGMAIHRVIGQSNTLITLESHGRAWPENHNSQLEILNLSRTVGWFTVHYPFLLKFHPNLSIIEQLSHVKHSLNSIPDQGWSYGIVDPIIRALNSSNPVTSEVGFNYLGNMSAKSENNRFEVVWETEGDSVGSNSQSLHPLDLLSYIEDDQIILHFAYDKISVKKEIVDALLISILSNLSEIRDGILSGNKNIEYNTNNFIYKDLVDSDIDDLLS
jgi:amino acid adenylation domain-containing protein/non-ribosomal peptide synthase protein (TIGR01720 family)